MWRRLEDHRCHRGARRDGQDTHASGLACACAAARTGAAAGAVPGGLIRKAKAVLQRGRLPRSARARPTGKMLPHQPARADAGHEESTRAGEIFIKHRAIDRVLGWRYSRG